eukprot:1244641-Pleurochrysis_carterae.AAC.1
MTCQVGHACSWVWQCAAVSCNMYARRRFVTRLLQCVRMFSTRNESVHEVWETRWAQRGWHDSVLPASVGCGKSDQKRSGAAVVRRPRKVKGGDSDGGSGGDGCDERRSRCKQQAADTGGSCDGHGESTD